MIVNISSCGATVIEYGVYNFPLSDYPNITSSQWETLLEFIKYEKSYGRQTEIVCEDKRLLDVLKNAVANPETAENSLLSEKNESGGDCLCVQNKCLTEFVYHATDIKATQQILSGGKLFSAVKAYEKTGDELASERCKETNGRFNDPADFFEYIMFCWGNCVVGDYVVTYPGVRFYFKYDDILRHPGHVFDGYHCIKIKDEIILSDYLHACIVPEQYKIDLKSFIMPELMSKVYFLPQIGLELCDWTKNVYDFVWGL